MNDLLYGLAGVIGLYFIVNKMEDKEEKPIEVEQQNSNRPFFRGLQRQTSESVKSMSGGKKKSKRKPRKSSRKKRKSSKKSRRTSRKRRTSRSSSSSGKFMTDEWKSRYMPLIY